MPAIIQINHLSKDYGEVRAVDGITAALGIVAWMLPKRRDISAR